MTATMTPPTDRPTVQAPVEPTVWTTTGSPAEVRGGAPPTSRPAAVPAHLRLSLVLATALLLLVGEIGLLAAIPSTTLMGQLALSVFLQFGPGVAWAGIARRLSPTAAAIVVVVGGPALVILAATTAALTGTITSPVLWPAVAALTVVGLVVAGARAVREIRATGPTAVGDDVSGRTLAVGLVAAAGTALCVTVAGTSVGEPLPGGAALTAGWLWFAGLAVVTGAVIAAWRSRSGLAVPVLCLTVVVPASQALMYREPTVMVSARHIGIVEFLLARGQLDRSTDIYQAWAGLFASAALNAQVAHVRDLFAYATWWGPASALLLVIVVRLLAGRFHEPRRAWLAALVFGLASSLTTPFFAPQVIGFALAFGVLALLVRAPDAPAEPAYAHRLVAAAVLSGAMAVTHQISPYLLALALAALAAFRLVRPWWAAAIPAVPAVAWALMNQHLLGTYVSVDAFGRLFDNLAPPEHAPTTFAVPLINRLTFGVPAVALVVIGVLAVLALVRAPSRLNWGLAVAAASPVALMAATSYGQEGIFRVVLFALPWLAVLACVPPRRPARRRTGVLLPAALVALVAVQVLGLTGMDWARVVRGADAAAVRAVETSAPTGSVVLSLGTTLTLPTASTPRYAEVGWISRSDLVEPPARAYPAEVGAAYDPAADLATLTEALAARPAAAHYVIAAESVGAWDQRYGYQYAADHDRLMLAVANSDQYRPVYTGDGVTVYQLLEDPR